MKPFVLLKHFAPHCDNLYVIIEVSCNPALSAFSTVGADHAFNAVGAIGQVDAVNAVGDVNSVGTVGVIGAVVAVGVEECDIRPSMFEECHSSDRQHSAPNFSFIFVELLAHCTSV